MTWLLLRGLTRESRHWGPFKGQLEDALQENVVTLDLPGNGALNSVPSPASVAGITNRVRADWQALGIRSPVKLLGMSLGGMVAAEWASSAPDEVARLALVNTSMRPFSKPTERLRWRNWPALAGLALRWNDVAAAEEVIFRLTCNRLARRASDLDEWARIRQSAPVSVKSALAQLMAAARFTADPRPPACPVLVLSSDLDHLVDPVCSRRLAEAWRVPHRQHRWAGHDLPHDDGPWLAQQMARWDQDGANWQHLVIR